MLIFAIISVLTENLKHVKGNLNMIGNLEFLQILDLEEAYSKTYSVPSKIAKYNWENGLPTQHTTEQLKDRIEILKRLNVSMGELAREIRDNPENRTWVLLPQLDSQQSENIENIAHLEGKMKAMEFENLNLQLRYQDLFQSEFGQE